MEEQILIDYFSENLGIDYIKIHNKYLLEQIYNLFINKKMIDVENYNLNDKNILYLYLGTYYHLVEKNYEEMKKSYMKAIDLNNDSDAMNNLGYYYQHTEINHNEMKKYYIMAIELKNHYAMINLGYYYYLEKNYEEAEKLIKSTLPNFSRKSFILDECYTYKKNLNNTFMEN